MSYSEQVRKDAKAAADYIREHGWCQGAFENPIGECCAAGGRNAAVYGKADEVGEAYHDFDKASRDEALSIAFRSEAGSQMVPFNDAPGRTKEEVLAVFDRIASGIVVAGDSPVALRDGTHAKPGPVGETPKTRS